MAFCRNCGQQILTGGSACERCGFMVGPAYFPGNPIPRPAGFTKNRRVVPRILSMLVPVVVIIVGAAALLLMRTVKSAMPSATRGIGESVGKTVGQEFKLESDWFQMMTVLTDSRVLMQSVSTKLGGDSSETVNIRLDDLLTTLRAYPAQARGEQMNHCPGRFINTAENDLSATSQFAEIVAAHPAIAPDEEHYVDEALRRMLAGEATIAETRDARLDGWLNHMRGGYERLREAHAHLEHEVPNNGSINGSR